MAMLIRWQFDSCDFIPADGYDRWWTDMHLDGQLQCEEALSFSGKSNSNIIVGNEEKYRIDLVKMTQQNLKTGKIRPIRRTIVMDFNTDIHYFERGRLKIRRSKDVATEPNSKLRRLQE